MQEIEQLLTNQWKFQSSVLVRRHNACLFWVQVREGGREDRLVLWAARVKGIRGDVRRQRERNRCRRAECSQEGERRRWADWGCCVRGRRDIEWRWLLDKRDGRLQHKSWRGRGYQRIVGITRPVRNEIDHMWWNRKTHCDVNCNPQSGHSVVLVNDGRSMVRKGIHDNEEETGMRFREYMRVGKRAMGRHGAIVHNKYRG